MDINFSRSADLIVMQMLGTYLDAQGMMWSDGVSQKQYEDWCEANKSPAHDIRSISWTPTKKEIISQLYWLPNARLLPPGADYLFLDAAWLLGVTNAIMILQRSVEAPDTGVIDDATKAAFVKWVLPLDDGFVNLFCDEYHVRVGEVVTEHPPNEDWIAKYWPNRLENARTNAMTIIRAGGPR